MRLSKLIAIVLDAHKKKYVQEAQKPGAEYIQDFNIFADIMLKASVTDNISDEILIALNEVIGEES